MNPEVLDISQIPVEFGECLGPLYIQNIGIPGFACTDNSAFKIPKSASTPLVDYYMQGDSDKPLLVQQFSAKKAGSTSNTVKLKDIQEFYSKIPDPEIKTAPVYKIADVLSNTRYDTYSSVEEACKILKQLDRQGKYLKLLQFPIPSYTSPHQQHVDFFEAIVKEMWPGTSKRDTETKSKLLETAKKFKPGPNVRVTPSDTDRLKQAYRFIHEKVLEWHSENGILNFTSAFQSVLSAVTYIKMKLDSQSGLLDVSVTGGHSGMIPRPKLRGKNGMYRAGHSDRIGIQP